MTNKSQLERRTFIVSPSDLTFGFSCPRCFYLKVVHGVGQAGTFPRIFGQMDADQRAFFEGKPTSALSPTLPAGILLCAETRVCSVPIDIPNSRISLIFRGTLDCLIRFDAGGSGIDDFKTTNPGDEHVTLYTRQLHAYAFAGENPAEGFPLISPVLTLGLFCLSPDGMVHTPSGKYAHHLTGTHIAVERNDAEFFAFLETVAHVLESDSPPDGAEQCRHCKRERDITRLAAEGWSLPTLDAVAAEAVRDPGGSSSVQEPILGMTDDDIARLYRAFPPRRWAPEPPAA